MNAILYARVSTEKQADKDLSIPAQLQAMRDYARRHDWKIAEEFIEPGASAKTADRPALQRLLSRIRETESQVDVVLVHKIDRLARNVYDHATIKALLKQRGIRLASVVENMDDSVSGQLVENIMASIAQFYSANLADEVRKGMRQKVLKGGWPHLAPRGYIHVNDDHGSTRVEPHPTEGSLIRQAFERYSAGWHSLKALAAGLAKDGIRGANGNPIAPSYVSRILANPFYVGRLHWNDIEVDGAHEALVSRELFDRVQGVLKQRFKDPGTKGRVNGFPLRGLAICATCRGRMTAGYQRVRWGYYRCCRHGYNRALCPASKYCRSDLAHRAIEKICWQMRLSSATVEAIVKAADRLIRERAADGQKRLNSLRMTRSKLVGRELKLTRGFVAGDVSPAAYKTAGAELRQELAHVENELALMNRSPAELMTKVERQLRQASTVWELHEQLSDNRQVELLRAVFHTIVLDDTGVVGFTLRPPFDAIFQNASSTAKDGTKPDTVGTHVTDVKQLASDIIRSALEPPAVRPGTELAA